MLPRARKGAWPFWGVPAAPAKASLPEGSCPRGPHPPTAAADARRPVFPPPKQFQMRNDEMCKVLCRIEKLSADQAKAFSTRIEDDYRVNM